MLRIDETSGTLVAPQASGLVESPPDREELLGLVTASWDAFAGELGLTGVRLLSREPVPYVDLLGLDEERNRVVVILVTGDTVEWQLGRALGAAADVASWDRERLLSVDTELEARRQGVAGARPGRGRLRPARAGDDRLARLAPRRPGLRVHGVDGPFGGERLLSVRREPADVGRPDETRSTSCCGTRSTAQDEDEYTEAARWPPPSLLAWSISSPFGRGNEVRIGELRYVA